MKECYFCKTKDGLKEIWYGEEDNMESCCMSCFNDPDNSCEESPIGSSEWYSTDYNWKQITTTDETKSDAL